MHIPLRGIAHAEAVIYRAGEDFHLQLVSAAFLTQPQRFARPDINPHLYAFLVRRMSRHVAWSRRELFVTVDNA